MKTRGHLLRVLGVGFGLAVIIGNTIGAGIFGAPGRLQNNYRRLAPFLLVWLAGGLYALLGAISLAELGTMIPRSGGQYVFARYALGEYAGFIVGWSDWISSCGSTAAVALLIGAFSGALIPALDGKAIVTAAAVTIRFRAAAMARNCLGQQHSKPHQFAQSAGIPRVDRGGVCLRRRWLVNDC